MAIAGRRSEQRERFAQRRLRASSTSAHALVRRAEVVERGGTVCSGSARARRTPRAPRCSVASDSSSRPRFLRLMPMLLSVLRALDRVGLRARAQREAAAVELEARRPGSPGARVHDADRAQRRRASCASSPRALVDRQRAQLVARAPAAKSPSASCTKLIAAQRLGHRDVVARRPRRRRAPRVVDVERGRSDRAARSAQRPCEVQRPGARAGVARPASRARSASCGERERARARRCSTRRRPTRRGAPAGAPCGAARLERADEALDRRQRAPRYPRATSTRQS